MKALIIKIIAASGVLNLASLVESNAASEISSVDTKGFPFGYLEETTASSTSIDYASLLSNWLFWAGVAVVGFFILRWVWDKFSRMVFYILLALAGLAYFGSVGAW